MEDKVSNRSLARKRLNSLYNLNIKKDEFYRMVCGYNDHVLKLKNFTEAVAVLSEMDSISFYDFYGYVYDTKYMVPIE